MALGPVSRIRSFWRIMKLLPGMLQLSSTLPTGRAHTSKRLRPLLLGLVGPVPALFGWNDWHFQPVFAVQPMDLIHIRLRHRQRVWRRVSAKVIGKHMGQCQFPRPTRYCRYNQGWGGSCFLGRECWQHRMYVLCRD